MHLSCSASNENKILSSSSSKQQHGQQQKERQFVRRLVRHYEKQQLMKKFNSNQSPQTEYDGAAGEKTSLKQKPIPDNILNMTTKSNASGGNGRLEVVGAMFSHTKDDTNSSKKKKKPVTSSATDSLGFKTGPTISFLVVPKSTLCNDLCKQVGTKLRIKKKPIFVFVVATVDTSKPFIVDLRHDLSGIDDGTTVYVTSHEEESKKKEQSKKNEDTAKDNNGQEEDDNIEKDPLEQVKEAYAEQE
jgi:hypothetical protein